MADRFEHDDDGPDQGEDGIDHRLDDRIDERLRSALAGTVNRESENATRVLAQLKPAVVRARRIDHAKQALLGVGAAAVLVGGIGLVGSLLDNGTEGSSTIAGVPDVEVPVEDDPAPRIVTGTTDASSVTVASADQAGRSTVADTPIPTLPESSATTASTSTSPTSTSSTTATSTSLPPGQTLIQSGCGSIVVSVDGEDVSVVEIHPAEGYSIDEKSSGPESIEVSFEGGGEHCELKAEVRNGELKTEVEQ